MVTGVVNSGSGSLMLQAVQAWQGGHQTRGTLGQAGSHPIVVSPLLSSGLRIMDLTPGLGRMDTQKEKTRRKEELG